MENIIDLKDLYNHLESDLHVCRYPSDLIQAIKIFRDKMLKEDNLKIAKIAQIELEALSYSLKNGIVEPFYILKDKDGVDIEFPKLSEYSEEYLDYLSSRMNASANPPLKSRYAHILWCSKRKHGLFARTALESYIKSLESYIDEYIASGIGEKEIVSIIKNIYYISKNLKNKETLLFVRISIHKLMPIFDVRHRLHFNLWVPLVEMMLEEKSFF